jgi:NAD(P)-dependent dehydrogenase (short-subunit alcohol dehydrogenase family)
MYTELKNKVVLITGGSKGIGFGIAQALLNKVPRLF